MIVEIVLQPRIGLNTIALVVRKLKEVNATHPIWSVNPIGFDIAPFPGVKPTEVRATHNGMTEKVMWLELLKLVRDIQNIVDPDCFTPEQIEQGAKTIEKLEREIEEERLKEGAENVTH